MSLFGTKFKTAYGIDEGTLGTVQPSCKVPNVSRHRITLEAQRSRPYPRSSMTSHPPRARHACPRIADGPAANGDPAQQPISSPSLDESAGPACSEVFTSSQAQNLVCVRVLVCPAVTITPGRPVLVPSNPGKSREAVVLGEGVSFVLPTRDFIAAFPRRGVGGQR